MWLQPEELQEHAAIATKDAITAFSKEYAPGDVTMLAGALHIASFAIHWPSTTCGYGGLGGAAFCWAPCTVVYDKYLGKMRVYHKRGFAYELADPNSAFFALLGIGVGHPPGLQDLERARSLCREITDYDRTNYIPRRQREAQEAAEHARVDEIIGENNE